MKKFIIRFIQLILLAIILYSGYKIGSYYYERYKAGKEFDKYTDLVSETALELEEEAPKDKDTKDKKPAEKKKFDYFNIQTLSDFKKYKDKYDKIAISSLKKFKEKNSDIVSFINIPGMSVKYPIVFKDNDFYLRRNLAGEYSWPGSIFIEEMNKPDFSDMNTVIYGHNMSNAYIKEAEMFDPILKFADKEYVSSKTEHYIDLFTEKGVSRYKIFSAYYVDAGADYRSLNMPEGQVKDFILELFSRSVQNFGGISPTEESKIITLSTCDNVNEDGRFTVHAIKVN